MSQGSSKTVDGFAGPIYNVIFEVPTYTNTSGINNTLTWKDIDDYYETTATTAVLNTVAFSISLVSLLYVIALTPASKRRLKIYTFLCSALTFEVIDRAIATSLLLHSPYSSSYILLTLDAINVSLSTSFKWKVGVYQIGSILTIVCLQACLYLHGMPLLSYFRLRAKTVYWGVAIYLVATSIIVTMVRIALAVIVFVDINLPLGPSGKGYEVVNKASTITATINIGSWSILFFVSAVNILVQRRKQLITQNKVYESVLNLIAFIGIESFILPLTCAVLQLAPEVNIILSASPEVLLIPSVLFVLPLASLFSSSRNGKASHLVAVNSTNNDLESDGSKRPLRKNFNELELDGNVNGNAADDSYIGIGLGKTIQRASGKRYVRRDAHPLEMELNRIDAMEDFEQTAL